MIVLKALGESGQKLRIHASRERATFENKIRDPDDCSLEVISREEKRCAQSLPQMIGIIHSRHSEHLDPGHRIGRRRH
jgi:hypothetical protein